MKKIDLHCHSYYSGRPSDWFLQRIGTRESYTTVEEVYRHAKEKGMDFVTITDHNTIEGAKILKEKYPHDVIIGCEWTTYFPEDGCKIHLLTYDITEKQFQEMDILRENIYKLRDYIKENNIAHSVAHATYSVNGKLTIEHIEKLILLFDNFEIINGSRSKQTNEILEKVLLSLTPKIIEELSSKYNIDPFSEHSWIKGFTGGSDDHANLFIGETYTIAEAKTAQEFINKIKNKEIKAFGRHNDYKSFAFTLYKILYDFSKNKTEKISSSFLKEISALLFEKKDINFITWLKAKKHSKKKKKNKEEFKAHLYELIDGLKKRDHKSFDEKFDYIFNKITDVIDDFLKILSKNIVKSFKKGDLYSIAKEISALLPISFLSLPFFSTFTHMHSSRIIIDGLKEKYLNNEIHKKKILWFTDTILDLNGVSVTIRNIGWYCHNTNRELKIVCSLSSEELNSKDLPPNIINLPYLIEMPCPTYESITLKIPSILKTFEILNKFQPDEIYISTPGFIGIIGLLYAKLTNTKTIGIYHTDFKEQTAKRIGEDPIVIVLDNCLKFFYNQMDEIKVPSNEYIEILTIRGYDRSKMSLFKRGIDDIFIVNNNDFIGSNIDSHINTILVYSGRISKDKNLDFLVEVFNVLSKKFKNLYLVIIGDGPYFNEFKKKNKENNHIILPGKVERKDIPQIFSLTDIFVFPSTTDTFGMAVLEAQACGLPAVVADIGGPKEIIIPNKTGFAIPLDKKTWIDTLSYLINMKENDKKKFISMKISSRENVLKNYDWEIIMQEIFEENNKKKESKNKTLVTT